MQATLTPRAHQQEAVDSVLQVLQHQSRAQIIMACGTGKTLVGRWVAASTRGRVTAVVVPSLALVAQTLTVWRGADDGWQFEALVLCSDQTTTAGEHERASADDTDIPAPFWARHAAMVTTSAAQASRVLAGASDVRPLVVFSTYHSAPVLAQACATSGVELDLVVNDEAHHLAGRPRAEFRTVLDEVPAARQIFMTATQVAADPEPGTASAEDAPLSMTDATVFGPVAYRLDFAAAIRRKLLADYQVVIFEAPGEQTPDPVAALTAAAARGLSRVLTFHGRAAKATSFAATVDGLVLPDGRRVVARAVTGMDPAIHRSQALRLLTDPDPEVLVVVSSARCLSEGVDVPAVDGVLFADPKNSEVDVVQSVGRVLRPSPGKDRGQVLIPVCHTPALDEDTTLSTSSFAAAWRILRGLSSLDPRLADELAVLRRHPSRRGIEDGSRGPARLEFDLSSTTAGQAQELIARIVDGASGAWDAFFADLQAYAAEHGHTRPPSGHRLHHWCQRQRTARQRGLLTQDRVAALRTLPGWVWDLHEQEWLEQWAQARAAAGAKLDLDSEVMCQQLKTRRARTSVSTVGTWCALQRILARHGDLDQGRRAQLEQIPGWSWSPLELQDAVCVDLLGEYVAWKGDANVPAGYVDDDQPLGDWVDQLRRRRLLGTAPAALLDEVAVVTPLRSSPGWLRWGRERIQWQLGMEALRQFADREGRCRIPDQHIEDLADTQIPLSVWCRRQRHAHRYQNLDEDKVRELETVPGWLWEIQPAPRVRMDIGDSRHGTRTGYVKGCRCPECTRSNYETHLRRSARMKAGGPSTDLVPAAKARGHLRVLQGQGATQKAIARAGDLNPKTVAEILNGDRARIHPETEKIVLAVTMNRVRAAAAPGTVVDAGPTWVLVDDLVGRGWPKAWIARHIGAGNSLQLHQNQVTAGTAAAVAQLHTDLEGIPVPTRRHRAPMPPLEQIVMDLTTSSA